MSSVFQILHSTMSESDQMSLGDSAVNELSQLFSQSQEGPATRDPFAADPVFASEEEMKKYLCDIGQKDSFVSPELVEIDVSGARKLSCDCGQCTGLNMSNQQEYLCCNQLFDWKEIVTDEEDFQDLPCVTKCEAYVSSVNQFAVKGECYINVF